MSAPIPNESSAHKPPVPKKKRNKKKKKNAAAKQASHNGSAEINGLTEAIDANEEEHEDESEDEALPSPEDAAQTTHEYDEPTHEQSPKEDEHAHSTNASNGVHPSQLEDPQTEQTESVPSDTKRRLDNLSEEREALRAEVIELRKFLESIQQKHERELSAVKGELEETQSQKINADHQYRTLLGKVNTIKAQLGERLKADAEELSQARSQIDELEEQNHALRENNENLQTEFVRSNAEHQQQIQEVSELRSRTNLSRQNWLKERDDLIQREAFAREEFETAKQAMQDWEVLAMEERSVRESLGERVVDLEEQLLSQKEAFDKAINDRDSYSQTVDGLQRALRDIQDARKKELRELVEQSQSQVEDLRRQLEAAARSSSESQAALESTRRDLERALPFEREVKEKNLLLGKLRHEAVILNDHLTKALRFLKRGRPEDNVDRQIVTNHLLHFLALDRSDPKKFQVLQLIAALLGWSEEQREQAGLSRPGSSNISLRAPLSPFRRAISSTTLNTDFMPNSSSKESLAELWSDFLEREAQEGSVSGSRRPSVISPTSPTPSTPGVKSP